MIVHGTLNARDDNQPTYFNPMLTLPVGIDINIDILGVFIACLKTDRPDGLFTTVVCDESGVCLGLVYSNELSIRSGGLLHPFDSHSL